jgi:hypothetical protein
VGHAGSVTKGGEREHVGTSVSMRSVRMYGA